MQNLRKLVTLIYDVFCRLSTHLFRTGVPDSETTASQHVGTPE